MKQLRVGGAIAGILLALVMSGVSVRGADEEEFKPLKIGSEAPPFRLLGVDGKMYSLQDFSESPILVVFFTCNHCPTAQAYEDRILALVKEYCQKGVAFVGVSSTDNKALRLNEMGYTDLGDTFEECKIRAKDRMFNFPYLYDGEKQEAARLYGPHATPHFFIFDKERKLRYEGAVDDSEKPLGVRESFVRNALDALLAGQAVPRESTPAIGCSIKWASKRPEVEAYMKALAEEPVTLEDVGADGVRDLMRNDSTKLRLITVWTCWTSPSPKELEELIRTHRMYRERGVEVVTLNADPANNRETALKVLKGQQASCRNLYFSGERQDLVGAIQRKWKGTFPYSILIQPGGKVVYEKQGPNDPLQLRRVIVGILGRIYP
ncbi:MAG TPA: redoxin domain-containing protein [Candidatus Sumerlaeota bacterium]|nr:redoxin domain-containing protein [Candidatus Sumerlaeota bacterium]HPS00459.1 redoxin domain-containing protein [Candidatus Sumerlaeota bacterium]